MSESTTQEIPDRLTFGGKVAIRGSDTDAGGDTNDPVWLDHDGTHYMHTNATVAGNVAWSSFNVGASMTASSTMEYTWRGVLPDNSTARYLMGGYYSYDSFSVDAVDRLVVGSYGSVRIGGAVSSALPSIPTTPIWLRGHLDVATAVCSYWYSFDSTSDPDAVSWTSLGTPTGSSAGMEPHSFLSGAAVGSALLVGGSSHSSTTSSYFGTYYAKFDYSDSVDTGPLVFDPASDIDTSADPDAGQASWTDSVSAKTWTVNRSATGLKTAVVTRPVLLFDGTDDYLQLPAADTPSFTATTGKYTVVIASREANAVAGNHAATFDSQSANLNGMKFMHYGTPYAGDAGKWAIRVGGATTFATNQHQSAAVYNEIRTIAVVVDDGALSMWIDGVASSANPVSITGVGTITHETPKIGRAAYGAFLPYAGEVFDALIFDGVALTETQLDALSVKLLAGNYA